MWSPPLSSYMENTASVESFHMQPTPLKQMYHLMTYEQYISSEAPVDMELDHADHPLAMANCTQHLEIHP